MPSFEVIGLLVLKLKILKVFTICGHRGYLGHLMFENNCHIHIMGIVPGQGQTPPGIIYFKSINLLSVWLFVASFPKYDFKM